jgi:hypothetical protein
MQMAELSTDSGTEDALLNDPSAGPMLRVIKDRFPTDFSAIVADVRQAARTSDPSAARSALVRGINVVVARDGAKLSQAPHPALKAVRTAQANVVASLINRPTACAAFLSGRPIEATLESRIEQAIGDVARLRLVAIADGRDHPARPASEHPDAATLTAFRSAIETIGMSSLAREMLTGQRTPAQALEETQCEAEGAFLKAVAQMPHAQGDALFAATLTS